MTALLVLGVIAYAPDFTTAVLPEAGGYLLGGSGRRGCSRRGRRAVRAGRLHHAARRLHPVISPARFSSRRVLHATWLGLMLGSVLVPQLFGTFTSYAARAALDYAGPLVDAAPTWYLVPAARRLGWLRSATRG